MIKEYEAQMDEQMEKGPSVWHMTKRALGYMLKIAWTEKKSVFLLYILKFFGAALSELKVLLLPKLLVDEIMAIKSGLPLEEHMRLIILYVGLTVGAEFLSRFLGNIADSSINWYSTYFDRILQYRLCTKSMEMDFQYTEDPAVLDQQNKAKEGISWYSGGVIGVLRCFYEVVYNLLLLCGVVTLIAFYCPLLIPVQILGMAVVCIYNVKNQKINVEFFLKLAKSNRLFGYFFFEVPSYRHGSDTRLYDSAEMFCERGGDFSEEQISLWHEQSLIQRINTYKSNLANAVRDGLSYLYMGLRALKGIITVGDFTMCASAASRLYGSLMGIGGNLQDLTQKCSYAYQFLLYLEYPDALVKGDRSTAQEGEHTIVFDHVSFRYPRAEEDVLRDVNLTIRPGEHLSVVGLNGAGKTTMIKLLCRLYDVTEGRILLDGVDIREYSPEEYRRLFAVVFQDFKLFPFSLRENVEAGDCLRPADDAFFEETLKLSGLYEDALKLKKGYDTTLFKGFDEDGTELSGGQQQKTAISRALYRNAPIVILDEPTAALDPLAEYEIYKKFDTLVGGKSAIYISHRLSSCKFCDHIAVFSDKTIKEYGTHEELVNLPGGIYAEMFAAQAQYYVDAVS